MFEPILAVLFALVLLASKVFKPTLVVSFNLALETTEVFAPTLASIAESDIDH